MHSWKGIVKHSVCTKHCPRCRTCNQAVRLPGQTLLSAATCFPSCCHQVGCFPEAAGPGWFKRKPLQQPATSAVCGGDAGCGAKRHASGVEKLTV